ncbi:MAG: hypothetical protein VX284_04330, partial [Candidatus Neomarinimicrobiota bacterium]|nr:hypothetical protein [Candidatus Neomarinimicrobiota bacterium]
QPWISIITYFMDRWFPSILSTIPTYLLSDLICNYIYTFYRFYILVHKPGRHSAVYFLRIAVAACRIIRMVGHMF